MTHAIPFSDREIEVPGGALRIRFAENDKREPNNDYDVSPRQPILNLAGDAGDVCVRTFSYTIHILARKRADPHYAFYHNFATGQKKKSSSANRGLYISGAGVPPTVLVPIQNGAIRAQYCTDIWNCDFEMGYLVRANMRVLHMQQIFFITSIIRSRL